jgi:hypothetical protein
MLDVRDARQDKQIEQQTHHAEGPLQNSHQGRVSHAAPGTPKTSDETAPQSLSWCCAFLARYGGDAGPALGAETSRAGEEEALPAPRALAFHRVRAVGCYNWRAGTASRGADGHPGLQVFIDAAVRAKLIPRPEGGESPACRDPQVLESSLEGQPQ